MKIVIKTSTTIIETNDAKCAAKILTSLSEMEEQKKGYPMPKGLFPGKPSQKDGNKKQNPR